MTDSVSRRSVRFRNALQPPPFPEQRPAALGVAAFLHPRGRDAVGAEVAEVLAQLAPGHQHPDVLEEAESEGPDGPLALPTGLIRIGEMELALEPDRLAQRAQIDGRHGL